MQSLLLQYVILGVGGVLLEALITQIHFKVTHRKLKKHIFPFSRYFLLLVPPTIASLFLMLNLGSSIVKVFIVFAFLGAFFEWLVGYSYNKIVGEKLWIYHRFTISTYTSVLALPIWGFAGILFWLITQVI